MSCRPHTHKKTNSCASKNAAPSLPKLRAINAQRERASQRKPLCRYRRLLRTVQLCGTQRAKACDTSDTWSALSPPNAPLSRVICCFHSETHPRPPGISCATVNPGLSLLQQRGSDHTAAAAAVSRMETTRGICDPMSAASFLRLSFGAQKLSSNVELLLIEIFPSSMRLLELK